ncbi:Uncharacterised protein [uncultured archaeon]|nr:Uncharacterised protein [uncultured archaeon]
MKNCSICKKEIEENEEVCHSCIEFFKYKYEKKWERELKRFLDTLKENENALEKTKSNRRYKNG